MSKTINIGLAVLLGLFSVALLFNLVPMGKVPGWIVLVVALLMIFAVVLSGRRR